MFIPSPYTPKVSPYREGYDIEDVGFLLTENGQVILLESGGELEIEGNDDDIILLEFGTELTLETREPLTA